MPQAHTTRPNRRRVRKATLALILGIGLSAGPVRADPLEDAVRSSARTPELAARDATRHPLEELRFAGVTPRSSVIEIWPGGGYWTEILAPYLHDHGRYTMAIDVPRGDGRNFALGSDLAGRMDGDPSRYGRVGFALFGARHPTLETDGRADIVMTFRNLHNWMREGDAEVFLASIRRSLKPHGVLIVEEHRARPDRPQDPQAVDGYVRQDYATALIEKAGFKLVASSELLANPRDTTHWPKGVWTLPPTLALGRQDRARYVAVGEADNFLLKFRKTP